MNIISILNSRKSVRKFTGEEVSIDILEKIINSAEKSEALFSNISIEFKLITDGHSFFKKARGRAGYFGKVFNAPHYIAAISQDSYGFLENMGYRMENIMIMAHELGLSTCWMELLFNSEKINDILNIEKGYSALVFTPIGYEKRPMIGRLAKIQEPKRFQRKELKEIVSFDKWNNHRDPRGNLEVDFLKILQHARLAPSWGNTQPWKFLVGNSKIFVFCQNDKIRARQKKLNYYKIDCGIIMLYVKLLAEEFGIKGRWILDKNESVNNEYNIPNNYEYVGFFAVS